jgi:hypothetical protein
VEVLTTHSSIPLQNFFLLLVEIHVRFINLYGIFNVNVTCEFQPIT